MASNTNKRNKGNGTLGPQKYLENPYRQKSMHDSENAYNTETLNTINRPNEYDLANLRNQKK